MIEITGDDIAALNDEDLRSLVGRLCESDLHSRNIPTSAVTWGGNQNAADGGIDARVRIEVGEAPGGFIPRTNVGFQVKKTDFTPGLIGPEMRPEGLLRNSISDLIRGQGAYIIASSGSNTSDSALTARLDAMRAAVADAADNENLHLDFYDRNRLATWIRNHPGLMLWVRQKIGRGVPGWQPYSSWAVSPDGVADEYLLDDQARLHVGGTDEYGIDVAQGIDRIRGVLREARGVVRLAGLSGVGKTRIVQALFDARVGAEPLDRESVLYTDLTDNPSPQPAGMISDLIALRKRAIVVVDNCPPDLHRRITEICRSPESLISAITVEYDVQDDEPEGTEVYRLEPSSVELVAKLVSRRFPTLTDLDVEKIAEFSGGNARIALALSNTLERHESVAGLRDEELFKRLFHQRQRPDDSLLKAAQACSLLYSFQGESLKGDEAELPKIAALAGIDARQLFAQVAQLKQRDLVQRRSVWRAILPHAIANRLATMALREIPFDLIDEQFNTERLIRSFSRRLGYLHESEEAQRIVEKWLTTDGLLGNVSGLTEAGLDVLSNVTPVSPEATLTAIERQLSGPEPSGIINDRRRDKICRILQSIAYDASLFDRCVAAIIPFVLAEHTEESRPIGTAFEGLFHVGLSGTHATVRQRAAVVDVLLSSNELGKRSLGLQLLQALMKTESFLAPQSFDFGARARDYGYWPKSREEQTRWFATALQLARKCVAQNDETAAAIRSMIAHSIWSIWNLGPEIQAELEGFADDIAATGYWQEGWIAVGYLLSRDRDGKNFEAIERLRVFKQRLRPKNIAERVRAVVLSPTSGMFDYADVDDDDETEPESPIAAYEKANLAAEELGKEVGVDEDLFDNLLPELVRGDAGRLVSFGRGLAYSSTNRRKTWDRLTQALGETEDGKRNVGALCGFLKGLASVDERLCETLLEEALSHNTLGAWFPILQSSVTISATGVDRLKRAVTLGAARAFAFQFLGWSTDLTADDLGAIVLSIAKQENGFRVAIQILSRQFHPKADPEYKYPPPLIDAGRGVLAHLDLRIRDNMFGYHLHSIATVCLRGAEGADAAQLLCKAIKKGLKDRTFRLFNHENLLQSLFQLQPRIALDSFFETGTGPDFEIHDFDDPADNRLNPLDGIPVEELIRWSDAKPMERYPAIARAVPYNLVLRDGIAEWTPLAIKLLRQSPDPVAVLEKFVNRFYPMAYSGSRAAIVESRLVLLDQLGGLENPSLAAYAKRIRAEIEDDIARMRKTEDKDDSWRDERFE